MATQQAITFELTAEEFAAHALGGRVQLLVRLDDRSVRIDIRPSALSSWFPLKKNISIETEQA